MTTAKWSLRALVLSAAAFVCVLIWFAAALPDQVPGHFDAAGEVDRYDSKLVFVLGLGAVGLLMIVLFGFARWWMPKLPASMINISKRKKDYWLRPENRDELNDIMASANEAVGALTLVLLTFVVLVSGLAGLEVDVPGWVFWSGFLTFFVALTAVLVPVFRRTRVPDERRPARR